MFCNQCEQTAQGTACVKSGVCGKTPSVAGLQDLLTYTLRGLSHVASEGRKVGVADPVANRFTARALFSTLTNVDFDPERFAELIREAVALRKALETRVKTAGGKLDFSDPAASFEPEADVHGLVRQAKDVKLPIDWDRDADTQSLQETTLYGLRGVAAYADHAAILGQEDQAVYAFLQDTLSALTDKSLGLGEWVGLALKTGETNIRAMELLDAANTGRYGHPVPTPVALGHKAGKAILVSGHDLKDLEDLLVQTAGTGISVYTHGEMLPCHGYPGLKKHAHLAGHYGTAWQNQHKEFAEFPGAILMTTNCIQEPEASYKENIFTTGLVGWPGVAHVPNGNFAPVIARALALPGFASTQEKDSVLTGFGRNAVLGVADKVIDAVKAGAIKHFFLVGGCDG
ncbi:MAG: hydroxylamine reductase, partial [Deltaproteobacteria bacterium]|nr:hydroxylamine reductase [Deltaproteobacteria bacterium]